MKKNLKIAFSGLDGSGKSTQVQRIKKVLEEKGYSVKVQQHFALPIGKVCEKIIKLSKDPYIRALTFALDEYAQKLDNMTDLKYDIILCDRSHYCAYAYLVAQGVEYDWIENIYKFSEIYDLCIYLDISVETSYLHKAADDISPRISDEQLLKVRDMYLTLVQNDKMVRVNAEQDVHKVTEDILELINKELG